MKQNKDKQHIKLEKRAKFWFRVSLLCYQLPIHFLVMGSVFLVAWVLDKFIEAIAFLVAFFILRYKFDDTFHHDKVWCCILITITMFTVSVAFIKPLYISLFSSILFAFFDTALLWYLKHVQDMKLELAKYKGKTIWTMNETELRDYCRIKGIKEPQVDFVVMVVQKHEPYWVIAEKLGYAECTMWDWSKACKKKLGIKSWKVEEN